MQRAELEGDRNAIADAEAALARVATPIARFLLRLAGKTFGFTTPVDAANARLAGLKAALADA
jgi:hypothetical protein